MNHSVHFPDRLKRSLAAETWRPLGTQIEHLLAPGTPEELERRRAHLLALILVAVVATTKHVTGLTEGSASYTVYLLAIAASALTGGIAPACVATMTSILLVHAFAPATVGAASLVLFALEGFGIGALVAGLTGRLREADVQLAALQGASVDLHGQVRRGDLARRALQHLEEMAPDAAVFVVNAQGLIVEWSRSAERMYGYTAERAVGANLADVFADPTSAADAQELLPRHSAAEPARRTGVHRRADGARVHVEFDVKRCRPESFDHFTVAVTDLSRRRETEAFREAALRAQTALQQAADDAQAQLAALESLTDPSVNPLDGPAAVSELLERLRVSIGADGVAVVQLGRGGTHVVAAAGLRAVQTRAPGAVTGSGAADGRVALVHNDPARVAHVSALTWEPTVSSLMVVPVSHTGQAAFRMEVVNERRARATEWDLALARVVADRLAQAMTRHVPADSANAVA